ncbi:hypothetical protein Tsubulata_016587 [Turnera subulata]|uniref:Cystatin domain-containing protein n=1 Tax=Turnera subulata TaxID=218843 RepID=A0A9Q0JID2_9ROSI|nr:hypothetical protein Tsubulata_016587 [Turnera subulata]
MPREEGIDRIELFEGELGLLKHYIRVWGLWRKGEEKRREERMEKFGAPEDQALFWRSVAMGKEEGESEPKKPRLGEKDANEEEKEPAHEYQWQNTMFIDGEDDTSYSDDDEYEPPYSSVSSDEDVFENKEEEEEYKRYLKQLQESEGFDVDFTLSFPIFGAYFPVDLKDVRDDGKIVIECVNFAVKDNNNNPRRPKLRNPEVLKATKQLCSGFNYLITFEAEDASTGKTGTYQTRVYHDWSKPVKVSIFRPKETRCDSSQN